MQSESLPRLKAPRDDGAILAYPPLDEVGALRAANLERLNSDAVRIGDRSLRELRRLARHEAVAAARAYLAEAGEPGPDVGDESLFVAGHQPELFHPGVWLKNFALHALARRHRATPLNLIVDNDTAKATVLRVPHGPHVAKVPFDSWHSETPYEERVVLDEGLFASLPERVAPWIRDWPFRPLLHDFWGEMTRHAGRTPLLGERLAAARRSFERAWGLRPLEVPLSRLCRTEAFSWFAAHLLRELPRFHADYNQALRRYRERHELRSPLHPVPDLGRDGDWLEAPFWTWRTGEPRRQRLWRRERGDMFDLRAGTTIWTSLIGAAFIQSEQLRKPGGAGFKIRTRALTTTLFARLLLGDLFIHGIGGGKYDEVTDDLFRQFFHVEPPRYLILTGTLLLPLERFPEADAERRRLQRLERDVRWNPQRHLGANSAAALDLVRSQRAWIERPCQSHAERAERFTQLRRLNEQLRAFARAEEERVRQARADAERLVRLHEVRAARDYAFCLYPEEMLRTFCTSHAAFSPVS
ncbi:MAG: hypothetical protein L0Y71_20265 [Gemmataceae bacterium]|nr:hypothetical protein [Gemmataceae bacterium]